MAFGSILWQFSAILSLLCILFIEKGGSLAISLAASGICSADFKKSVIKLQNGEESVAIITDGDYFSQFTGRYPFNCKFVVKAKDHDDGLYVVIQDLNFRKVNGTCMDYVQFGTLSEDPLTRAWGTRYTRHSKYCGVMGPGMWLPPKQVNDASSEEETIDIYNRKISDNSYIATNGEVSVEIAIAAKRPEDLKKLVINLAFTSYREGCTETPKKTHLYCRAGECIYSNFFNDGIQNCPYTSCADEKGCRAMQRRTDDWTDGSYASGIGTKVTFGAVGAILLILLKFGLCLWLCKRLHKRRARRQPANPAPRISIVERPQPSAPPEELEIETKDLPPSYESLYPEEQRVETRT